MDPTPPSAAPNPPHSHPPLPPTTATATATATTKLRLMCSYDGHIIPRPNNKSLFYAGGETRIVALDRRTTASSLSALASHLSRTLFNNRPFNLKYQLPNEDLDSLISVTTDEDLYNMLEEHDRINDSSPAPGRIRLFLFPVKPESLGSSLLDPKSESWFSDALKSTRILRKGESADTVLLMDLGLVGGSDLEAQLEGGSNNGGGGGGSESKQGGAESVVLETSSSFGSTSSSISMSNLPPIGVVHCDENGLNLLDKKIRLPSSASIESDNSNGSSANQPKTTTFQEPLVQISSGHTTESTSIISTLPSSMESQQTIQILGHELPQQPDEKQLQSEMQYIHQSVRHIPQYPRTQSPIPPYYPVYQMPIHHQQHMAYAPNQPYPVYLVPVRPNQYHNMPLQYNFVDPAGNALSLPPLHPTQPTVEPSAKASINGHVSVPFGQGQQLNGPSEVQNSSESVIVTNPSAATKIHGSEMEDDIAYNAIYKTQPSAPVLHAPYQTLTNGAAVFSESSIQLQPNAAKQQFAVPTQ